MNGDDFECVGGGGPKLNGFNQFMNCEKYPDDSVGGEFSNLPVLVE